jgi:amino acid adenylation domain-containing protein
MTMPNEGLQGLSPDDKRRLLEQLLRERAQPRSVSTSYSQERMWLLNQLEPEGSTYNLHYALRLRGPLDADALEGALTAIVRRHESLRTTFVVEGGRPHQVIAPEPSVSLARADLQAVPSGQREAEAKRLCLVERHRPFDLERGPLLRVTSFRLGPDEHLLFIVIHHIIADGWSIGLLLYELGQLYGARVSRRPDPLAPLPLQYADYTIRQREWLQGDNLRAQLEYWRGRLGDLRGPLELPVDGRRSTQGQHEADSRDLVLSPAETAAIKEASRSEGATPFMFLLAGLQALLHRLSGADDIVVGSPIAGRTIPEIEGLIGFFVNMLVLRTDVGGNPSFRLLLARARETALGGFAHQEVPFERLLEDLRPERDRNRTPLFQVYLNMLSFREVKPEFASLEVEALPPQDIEANFDLTLYVKEEHGAFHLSLVFRRELFSGERVEGMLRQLRELYVAGAQDLDRLVGSVSLQVPAGAVLPDPACPLAGTRVREALTARLSAEARRAGERIAISSGQGHWSYGQLEARSNRLAHELRRAGVGSGDVVAIWAQRSPLLVCSMLGTLKAGAAFAILDPAYPAARLTACWRAASPRGLLLLEGAPDLPPGVWDESSAPHLAIRRRVSTATLDVDLAALPAEPPVVPLDADTPAYVAFTSGTTGGVKAILGTHGPLVHFLDWHAKAHELGPDDRFSMLSGLSHDPLLRDVFAPSWVGASLHVPDPEPMAEPGWLAEWMIREGITVAHLTPAMSQLLATGPTEKGMARLRRAFFGGEALTRGAVARFRKVAPAAICANFYGATETPQAMGYYVVPQTIPDGAADTLPIGRGIDGVQLLVMNPHGVAAGIGELGEIVVRTPYLTRGYLGDDALTQRRFVANPVTGDPADRVYRTGDLGRYGPDGTVEFAGRADTQIKLRGFRIELGEIEATLREHPAVQDAAVLAVREGSDDRSGAEDRLIAYLVHEAEVPPTVTELRRFVRERLPDYMTPASFAVLDALPLTPNGKVDRRALTALSREEDGYGDEHLPPRTEMEKFVAEVWRELLGIRSVGVRDNFFDLGGHSLLAVAAINRIETRVGRRVSLREMMYQTLEQFASSLEPVGRPLPEPAPAVTPTFAGRLRGLLRRRGVDAQRRPT